MEAKYLNSKSHLNCSVSGITPLSLVPAQVKLIQERGLVGERNLGVGAGGARELVLSHRAETVAQYLRMWGVI